MTTKVVGYCPMGCGETLFLGDGGYITCALLRCPRPDAATVILDDGEVHHIVSVEESAFAVQHPLRERLDGDLFRCSLHGWLTEQSGPPKTPGTYRVLAPLNTAWRLATWEPVDRAEGE